MTDLSHPAQHYARRYLALLIETHADCVCGRVTGIAHGLALDVMGIDDAIADLEQCDAR